MTMSFYISKRMHQELDLIIILCMAPLKAAKSGSCKLSFFEKLTCAIRSQIKTERTQNVCNKEPVNTSEQVNNYKK